MKTLKINSTVRLSTWEHKQTARVGSAAAYSAQYGGNGDDARRNAIKAGHAIAYIYSSGSCIDNSGESSKRLNADFDAAVTVEADELVTVEGEQGAFRVVVMRGNERGIRNSDPLHLKSVS